MSWWKKIVLGVLGLFGLAILFLVIEHFRGTIGLRRWLARMEAKGEVFRVDALTPPPIDPRGNGMSALIWAGAQLSGIPPEHQPPIGRYVAPGKMLVAWRLEEWPGGSRGATNITWQGVAEHLESRSQVFEDLREALDAEYLQATLDYQRGFSLPLPHLARMKGMAQAIAASVVYELHRRNSEEALRNLELLIRFPARWNREPLLISHLVRVAVARIGMNATWQALQGPDWSDAQLQRMQKAWNEIDILAGIEPTLTMERAMARIELESFRNSDRGLSEFMDFDGGGASQPSVAFTLSFDWFMDVLGQTPDFFNTAVFSPIWKFAWSHQNELHYLQNMQRVLEVSRAARERKCRPVTERDADAADDDWGLFSTRSGSDARNFYDRLRFPFSPMLEDNFARALRRFWIAQTLKELTVAAIALRRYELQNGHAAPSLEALVPEFATEVPHDYMDGKPLKYKANATGVSLYSVGDDGIDQGGDTGSKTATGTSFNLENSRDWVWPAAATPSEVQAFNERNLKRRK